MQGGLAPLVAGFIVALLLSRLKLGGLAAAAGFLVCVALVSGFAFTPLTATRKIVTLGIAAPLVGIAIDLALKAGRTAIIVLATLAAVAAVWVFWPVLAQKDMQQALLAGAGVAALIAWLVSTSTPLGSAPLRAGAASLALGVGTGACAILGGSALYGQYGIALGAGTGGFLLWQMLSGKKIAAGATLTLPMAIIAGLLGAGAVLLAQLPWYAPVILALVPLAARLPAPERSPAWIQAVILSVYTLAVAAAAFFIVWRPGVVS